jgi:DNA-binding Xre family transcriptional regulator
MSFQVDFEDSQNATTTEVSIESLKDMVKQLQTTNAHLEASQVELEAKIQRLENQIEVLNEEKTAFQTRIVDLEALCNYLESQLSDLNKLKTQKDKTCEETEADCVDLVRFGAKVASHEIEARLLPDLYGLNDDLTVLLLNQKIKFDDLNNKHEQLKSEFVILSYAKSNIDTESIVKSEIQDEKTSFSDIQASKMIFTCI